ncbi:hypothetical protein M1615_01180 [Patescibacteria group bacterium]|nr:hypothetical protein [Patescibacteria group bacterium]MCL5010153.1 hypothetical protein [Patescibacteria group bacterium]
MKKNIVIFTFCLVAILFLRSGLFVLVKADSTSSSSASSQTSSIKECADNKISVADCPNFLQNKVNDLNSQANTLSSQIAVMDSQINLTQARIYATKQQIATLAKDINTASKKIDGLNGYLDNLTKVLINRIIATYEAANIQPIQILLTSGSASDFLSRLSYLQIAQAHDKKLIYDTQQAKDDYANQKQIFQDKKKQVEALRAQLESYTKELAQEKQSKKDLLTQTQGSEANYQNLLAQAKAQLAAFSNFVTSQGGVTLITADPSWPSNYYSQLDKRWGNVAIAGYYSSPNDVTSIGASGCLITSVAMVSSKRGNAITPLAIGTNGSYFFDADFRWSSPGLESFGLSPTFSSDTSIIDTNLSQGKWVIVGISSYPGSHYPFHFVVITSKNGSDYNLFDPWKGPNVSFNSNYGSDYITEIITY